MWILNVSDTPSVYCKTHLWIFREYEGKEINLIKDINGTVFLTDRHTNPQFIIFLVSMQCKERDQTPICIYSIYIYI